MKIYLSMLVGLLAACSGSAEKQVAAPCTAELLTKRASDAKAADIIVVGKWVAAEPDITPEIPIRVGTIEVASSIRGSLADGEMVVVLTNNITDNGGKILECGLSEPQSGKSQTFYINQNPRSLKVVDYQP